MSTSGTSNFNATRDQIVTRALRIVQAIGQGETPSNIAIVEGVTALNNLLAEWNVDGMPQWNLRNYTCTPLTANVGSYSIGVGQTFNFQAPLKVIQAYLRDVNTGFDQPLLMITRTEYNMYTNKFSASIPNQIFYQTPVAIQASGDFIGTIYLLPLPDTYAAANKQLIIVGQKPLDDFDVSTDTLDFPPYWINALTWGLADQLSFEYGLSLDERGMIQKKMLFHKDQALSFGTEEGSFFLQPGPQWSRDY